MEKEIGQDINTDDYIIDENLINLNFENSENESLDNIRPNVNNQVNEVLKTFNFITKSEENFSFRSKQLNNVSSKQDDDLYILDNQIDSLNDNAEENNLSCVADIQYNKNH